MNAKGNQPILLHTVSKKQYPLITDTPDHIVRERARPDQPMETWITNTDGIGFPHAQQVGFMRQVFDLDQVRISREYTWIPHQCPASNMTATDLHEHVRAHWEIEDKRHNVRDTAWREDAHHLNIGNAPQVMATLRNGAASLLRSHGHRQIKKATEWIGRNPCRALAMLIT